MNRPYKLIWKYKNNNRYVQYNTYIFVGDVTSDIKKILDKIKNLSLSETFIQINKGDIKKMENLYGNKWYAYFFNMYHIGYSISQIQNNATMGDDLIEKFGQQWYDDNIKAHKWADKKILYSYSSLINADIARKMAKKTREHELDDETNLDYKVSKKENIMSILEKKKSTDMVKSQSRGKSMSRSKKHEKNKRDLNNRVNVKYVESDQDDLKLMDTASDNYLMNGGAYGELSDWTEDEHYKMDIIRVKTNNDYILKGEQKGGNEDDVNEIDDDVEDEIDEEEDDEDKMKIGSKQEIEDVKFDSGLERDEVMEDEELDIEEIEKLYQSEDIIADANVTKTSELIKNALDDDNLFKRNLKKMIEFEQNKDALVYADNLKSNFDKYYVTTQYIYEDDTVKRVKEKICCAIKNNKKFGDTTYLAPSRQYIWAEYIYDDNIDKVSIGHKWIRRNELLDIDIEPSNKIHVYEKLEGKLGILRHNIKRYGNKIRREDDENDILTEYVDYITNNELYMIDIYNELGKNYKPDAETLKKIQDVYVRLYFPKLRSEDMPNIIDYLNGNTKLESIKISTIYDTLSNDIVLENDIVRLVEETKKENIDYILKQNYVTHSAIRVNLKVHDEKKLDLYRIFNNFKTTDIYPFIQYRTIGKDSDYKYNESEISNYVKDKDNLEIFYKWFEYIPYGINVKMNVSDKKNGGDKFITIGLNEGGRIEYKIQWKETDMATIDDIKNTYNYVKKLVEKINEEVTTHKIRVPEENEFKFAFINTIQKFDLPEKFTVNHNDLSEFSRYFFPYIALVIEPRKRISKKVKEEFSKYGTYLRYKRVSKYENFSRIEQRIIYFMRNYEFQDDKLASELAKQFNITEDRTMESIKYVKEKYPNLKKSRKVLKKLVNIPKYKPAGIGIDIQGKHRDNYKIRIVGARNVNQLENIVQFMKTLMHLYVETYLYKKKERMNLKEKLKKLTNIAKRRLKVDDLVDYSKEINTVKHMEKLDKLRIGFKPGKGQNQWTRSCQNSGTDKKRRPQQYNLANMTELLKKGYKYDKQNDVYVKTVKDGKKEVTLRTIKVPEYDENGRNTGNYIHYACYPEENGEHMYIGFLTRSANPHGHCMPCCFKKDPSTSNNKTKRIFFENCLGKGMDTEKDVQVKKTVGDKLYILQDTNKIQDGRFSFLPKYLDRYLNFMLGKTKKIKNHYLEQTRTGYFFKYGLENSEYQFLNAISTCLEMTLENVRNLIIDSLKKDNHDQIFTSLNAGDIKTQFKTKENYIDFIEKSPYLDFPVVKDIICLPNVLTKNGINLVIFHKKNIRIKKTLEKERIIEDFYLECSDSESHHTIKNPNYITIFLIRNDENYYPIVLVKKNEIDTKDIIAEKTFKYEDIENNIVNHVFDFFDRNCSGTYYKISLDMKAGLNAKQTAHILRELGKEYSPRYQIIDVRNKCKYIITSKGLLVPVKPSGSLWDVQIIKKIDRYFSNFKDTYDNLMDIYKKSKKRIIVKPIGVYYESKKNNEIQIIAIMTKLKDVVPITPANIAIDDIKKYGLIYEKKSLTDKIDNEIMKGDKNYKIDNRIMKVNENIFIEESYNLFRLELSNYLNKEENLDYKNKFQKIMNSKIIKSDKVHKIRLLLYKIIDKNVYDKYIEITKNEENNDELNIGKHNGGNYLNGRYSIYNPYGSNNPDFQIGGKINKLIHKLKALPDLANYEVNNERSTCDINNKQEQCDKHLHCRWTHDKCYMGLTVEMIIMFVNRISEELAQNNMKAFEIMKINEYYVSDIVDLNNFTNIPGQTIIRASSSNIKRIFKELFSKDNIPNIGKKFVATYQATNHELNDANPLVELKDIYVQKIIANNITILRAYANGYHWIKNNYYDSQFRNLGYYSNLQSDMANKFKSMIIDWLSDQTEQKNITSDMLKNMGTEKLRYPIREFINKFAQDVVTITNGTTELTILSKLINTYPIIVQNEYNKVLHIFDNGKHLINPSIDEINKYDRTKCINLRYEHIGNSNVPDIVEVIYYK